MKYKMLCLDIDGTLLNDDSLISDENLYALDKAKRKGIKIAYASGRIFQSVKELKGKLEIDTPFIGYNGAWIKDLETDIDFFHNPIPLKLAEEVADVVMRKKFHLNIYIDDKVYVFEKNGLTEYYYNSYGVSVEVVGNLVSFLKKTKRPPTKMLVICETFKEEKIFCPPEEIKKTYLFFKEYFKGRLFVTESQGRHVEFLNYGVSKGDALKRLAGILDIKEKEVVAVGDGINDIEMLQAAGLGVAVKNAAWELKKVADRTINVSNNKHAIAETLKKFF
jgi:Cof subfamily protein (haloacid dehalogenase superfamily)